MANLLGHNWPGYVEDMTRNMLVFFWFTVYIHAHLLMLWARYIYWTDWGNDPKIERSYLDGDARTELITSNLQWPNGLTIGQCMSSCLLLCIQSIITVMLLAMILCFDVLYGCTPQQM